MSAVSSGNVEIIRLLLQDETVKQLQYRVRRTPSHHVLERLRTLTKDEIRLYQE